MKKTHGSSVGRRCALAAVAIVPLIAIIVAQNPAAAAWFLFVAQLQLGQRSTCFFENTLEASFFMRAHRNHFGDSPPEVPAKAVIELRKEDYSYEALRKASHGFTEPVVVRGLFADAAAVKWTDTAGLVEALSGFNVSVTQNSTMGKDHWMCAARVRPSSALRLRAPLIPPSPPCSRAIALWTQQLRWPPGRRHGHDAL